MTNHRRYSLEELLSRLGMEYDSKRGKMNCFACGKKSKINLDFDKNRWRCPSCGISGGVLDLFSLRVLNEELPKKAPTEITTRVRIQLDDFMTGGTGVYIPPDLPKRPKTPEVPISPDSKLHAVYEAMQKLPELALTPKHRENLQTRGLSDGVIVRNGYRSVPDNWNIPELYSRMYAENGGDVRRANTMGYIDSYQIQFGLMIAHILTSQGFELQGVPGFFRFGKVWCYWAVPGLLIPTRNINGEIVIWQVRRDKLIRKDDLRYITVANRKLPGHVSESVSRCHFPIGNALIKKGTPILVTEGSLKADVACHLYGAPVVFAAIPGISTTEDLLRNCENFKRAEIRVLENALDMDRFTNPNVRKGSAELAKKLSQNGLRFVDRVWDEQYAACKLLIFTHIAKLRNVPIPQFKDESVFARLNAVGKALNHANIDPCKFNSGKSKKSYYWDTETKGIDDFLLNR